MPRQFRAPLLLFALILFAAVARAEQSLVETFDQPKLIDLELKQSTVADALKKIKTHFALGAVADAVASKKKIDLTLKQATWFESVDAVRHAAQLHYDHDLIFASMLRADYGDKKKMRADDILALRIPSGPYVNAAAAKGPLLLLITTLNAGNKRQSRFNNLYHVHSHGDANQPSVRALLLTQPGVPISTLVVAEFKVLDEAKNPHSLEVTPALEHTTERRSRSGLMIYQFDKPFAAGESVPQSVTCSAKFRLEIPEKIEEQKFTALAEKIGKPQPCFSGTLLLEKIEREKFMWNFHFTVEDEAAGIYFEPRSYRVEAFAGGKNKHSASPVRGFPDYSPSLEIVDAKGEVIGGPFAQKWSAQKIAVENRLNSEPQTIVVRKPSKTVTREIEITLPTLKMP